MNQNNDYDFIKIFNDKYNLSFLDKLKSNPEIAVYVFGGAIRDIFLNRNWSEIDLRIIYNKPQQIREQTIEVLLKDFNLAGKSQIEALNLTVYRFLPTGSKTSAPIDLSLVPTINDNLPDFTINSIFYDLINKQILDKYNGINDLMNKTIKTVQNPNEQLKNEPHMIFRAIKFSCQLDFEIEEKTKSAMINNKKGVQKTLNFIKDTQQGVFVELFLGNIFKGLKDRPLKFFNHLNTTGLLQEFDYFLANEIKCKLKSTTRVMVEKDLGSYENNISYFLSEIVNNTDCENKKETFLTLIKLLALSTPKQYSDFIIDVDNLKFIAN